MDTPRRIFLDTNVFIIGVAFPDSAEASILNWIGFFEKGEPTTIVITSDALIEQLLRVGRRVGGKDHSSQLIVRLWENLTVDHIAVEREAVDTFEEDWLPREDVSVFLSAQLGQADCFISANHKLIKALATRDNLFECLTPAQFVAKYLRTD